MIDIRERLLAAFRVEYKDHLEHIREALAREGPLEPKELDEVFRRAHSLKGAARACDLRPIETLAHRLETAFGRIREGRLSLDAEGWRVIEAALDAVEDWVSALDAGEEPAEPAQARAALDALLSDSPRPAPAAPPAKAPDATRPTAPTPAEQPPRPPPAAGGEETVRIGTSDLDRLLRSAGRLLVESHGQEAVTRRLHQIEGELALLESHWGTLRKPAVAALGADAVATLDERLHALAAAAREARLAQQRSEWTLRQLSSGLQEDIRLARMIPAEHVFGGFRKMMRDLAREEGKEVEVRVTGLGVRADRMVLQMLKDPVMHMLRNALFHGIEEPEERRAAGKDATGRITLAFGVSGNRLCLSVEDDGRGLDLDKVREQAVRQGLLGRAEAEDLDGEAVARLIFQPGFSTAGRVTNLAGRGMGMSVVYETVVRLNGSLEVPERAPGTGSLFRLMVPLSVATHRLLLVSFQERTYALPAEGVERLTRLPTDAVRTVEGQPVVGLDGRQLRLVGLGQLLDLPQAAVTVQDGMMPVAVLRSGEARVAVAVDAFIAIREGLVQDLGVPTARDSKVAGGTILEDGEVVIVLSPFQLVEACRRRGGGHRLATAERTPAPRTPRILVVDDSITTRTLEKSILEAHGYHVLLAVDGLEALAQLRSQEVDLVVADVQMPRLDGFGLLREMKKEAAFAGIPVIIVTSLESREDRERGLSLGADAYVVKTRFDQQELLETIEQLL